MAPVLKPRAPPLLPQLALLTLTLLAATSIIRFYRIEEAENDYGENGDYDDGDAQWRRLFSQEPMEEASNVDDETTTMRNGHQTEWRW